VGVASYGGQAAMAIGGTYKPLSANITARWGVGFSGDKRVLGQAGISWSFK
jgi:hypothetical protein